MNIRRSYLLIFVLLPLLLSACATTSNIKKQSNVMNIWISPEYVPQERMHHPYIPVAIYTQPTREESKIAGEP